MAGRLSSSIVVGYAYGRRARVGDHAPRLAMLSDALPGPAVLRSVAIRNCKLNIDSAEHRPIALCSSVLGILS